MGLKLRAIPAAIRVTFVLDVQMTAPLPLIRTRIILLIHAMVARAVGRLTINNAKVASSPAELHITEECRCSVA